MKKYYYYYQKSSCYDVTFCGLNLVKKVWLCTDFARFFTVHVIVCVCVYLSALLQCFLYFYFFFLLSFTFLEITPVRKKNPPSSINLFNKLLLKVLHLLKIHSSGWCVSVVTTGRKSISIFFHFFLCQHTDKKTQTHAPPRFTAYIV